jgi:hypothetical protein
VGYQASAQASSQAGLGNLPSSREVSSTCGSLGSSDNIRAHHVSGVSDIEGGKSLETSSNSSILQVSQSSAKAEVKAEAKANAIAKAGVKAGDWKFFGASVNQYLKVDEVVEKLESGRLWVVNGRRRNGLIVLREFHAEFAGPGAAVGGDLDQNIVKIIPIGNLSLLEPDSHEAHQNAIKIRLQWIRLTQNFTDQPSPDDRARMILEQFKTYFDQATVDSVPDEAFALLVGVLPQTIHRVRSGFVW